MEWVIKLLLKMSIGMLIVVPIHIGAQQLSEYEIKTGFIYNFVSYTQWPLQLKGTLNLCTYGNDLLSQALIVLEGDFINENRITFHRNVATADFKSCHVLYLANTVITELTSLQQKLSGLPVLVITASPEDIKLGVIINMQVKNEKVYFQIDRKAALSKNLNISSRLLSLADKVIQ